MDQEFKEQVNDFMIFLGVFGALFVVAMAALYFYIKYKTKQKRALEKES